MYAFLTIDHGNTSTKACLWVDGGLIDTINCREDLPLMMRRLLSRTRRPIVAILCSVRPIDDTTLALLHQHCIQLIILDSNTPLPIKIEYKSPDTLGPDRIAAAVGAYNLYGGNQLLVADLGTAATFDSVTADGRYQGGNIAPGVGMRLKALHEFTSRLPLLEIDHNQSGLLGQDTPSAIENGAVNGVVAELDYYASRLPQPCITVVTGGDALLIAKRCQRDIKVDETLVQRGLYNILQANIPA